MYTSRSLVHHLNDSVPGLPGQDFLETLILHRSGTTPTVTPTPAEMGSRVRRETMITAAGREKHT